MQDSVETKAILRQMEEVRRDLDDGAQEIVESARDLGEWRHYVKNYPWTCMGIAFTIGYLIVPRRRLELHTANRKQADLVDHSPQLTKSYRSSAGGIGSAVKVFAGNLLWRSALSYAARQAKQYLELQFNPLPPEDGA